MLSIAFPYCEGQRDKLQAGFYSVSNIVLYGPIDGTEVHVYIENATCLTRSINVSNKQVILYYFRYLVGPHRKHVPVKIICNGNVIYIYEKVKVVLYAKSLFLGNFKVSVFHQFSLVNAHLIAEHLIVTEKTLISNDTKINEKYTHDTIAFLKREYPCFDERSISNERSIPSSFDLKSIEWLPPLITDKYAKNIQDLHMMGPDENAEHVLKRVVIPTNMIEDLCFGRLH